MKALVKDKPVRGATFAERPIPQIGDNDLLVKVHAAAICGTDIHIYQWNEYASSRIKLPLLFGHEYSAEVVEVGKNVGNFRKGDRVAAETHVPCGHCFQCTTGLQHICRDMKILGVHMDGAFSEYSVLPAVCAWKLDPAISYEMGATMEPFGIGVHAMSKTKPAGKKVIVYGCGPIGIYAQMVAKASGAEFVIGVDVSEERLALAKKMGTDIVLNAKKVNVVDEVNRITKGLGTDIVVELTGNKGVVNESTKTLRRGGDIVLVGLYSGSVEWDLVNNVIYKEANVYGVTGRIMWDTWWTAQSILLSGKCDPSPVITHYFDLKEYDNALQLAESASTGKIVFKI
ncbi:MAG TPA: L-threonine 3-dehydrogenase [Thermodesulfobacteriota bacterium]|nr:L-threonine 3-dehydrogenase [Thermodesulfobacteriota bacterium]